MHEKLRRFYVQLLADVFADRHQRAAALATGAACWLVTVLDARQMLRQRLPTGAFTRDTWRGYLLLGFSGNGGAIHLKRLAKQIALLGRKGFVFDPETNALEVRQVESQRLDFQCIKLGLRTQIRGFCCFQPQWQNSRHDAFLLDGIEV
jgi:hypothetical protein